MANSYHTGTSQFAQPQSASQLLHTIDAFIQASRTPAVLEYGEEVMPLRRGEFELQVRSDRLWIDVWHENRNLSRRILSIESRSTGVLDCSIHRFGGTPGKMSFLDLDRPQTAHRTLSGIRRGFAEQFRRMLSRQLPGWDPRSLSAGMDLQRSFSPLFPRARLTRRQDQIAAIACPDPLHESACLTFALLWFDHLRKQARGKLSSTSLHLFLPEEAGCLTAHRLRWLARHELGAKLFLFNAHGSAGEVDPDDLGNLDSSVQSRFLQPHHPQQLRDLLRRLALSADVGLCPELNGDVSIRFRGIEFARVLDGHIHLGLDAKEKIASGDLERVVHFADHLHLVAPELVPQPERWLESAARASITALDPTLRPEPVHSQVLSIAGRDRDAIDLLAASPNGRLTVIELKTAEDIHLPMQALDYWMRIKWHAQKRELDHLFPGCPLQSDSPRLLLVAPALSFHSTNETVLRYFSPDVNVERVGINSDWQTGLRVVLRLNRGDRPQSHKEFYEHQRLTTHQEGDRESES